MDNKEKQGVGLRAQKNVASKLSKKQLVKKFMTDDQTHAFDTLFTILTDFAGKKQANKIFKYTIKICFKFGVLIHNNQIPEESIPLCERLVAIKMVDLAKKLIRFYDRSSHRGALTPLLEKEILSAVSDDLSECRHLANNLISSHITGYCDKDRNLRKMNMVFDFFCPQSSDVVSTTNTSNTNGNAQSVQSFDQYSEGSASTFWHLMHQKDGPYYERYSSIIAFLRRHIAQLERELR